MSQGWIKLYRQIQDCDIWHDDEPFDRRSAWIDILLMANHQDKNIILGNQLIEVKRGSFITSEVKLMDKWKWSKTKLRSFLYLLEQLNMIEKISDKKKTTINIVNYRLYQEYENQEKTIKEPQENQEKTIEKPKKDTNNNDKNDNNEKEIYIVQAEELWNMYPNKKGKAQAIKKIPKIIQKEGYEQLQRCIERYMSTKESWKQWQNGSTFFNSGYVDYLDNNFTETKKEDWRF